MWLTKTASKDQFKPNLSCIQENDVYDMFACHVTLSQIPCFMSKHGHFFPFWEFIKKSLMGNILMVIIEILVGYHDFKLIFI